jgi:hypothetical protein
MNPATIHTPADLSTPATLPVSSAPVSPAEPPTVRGELRKRGYINGERIYKKEKVFMCIAKATKVKYVCKVQTVKVESQIPIEAKVFKIIKDNSLKSLVTMHELIDLHMIENKKTFVEVIDYLSPDDGWATLYDFKVNNLQQLNTDAIIVIFRQIIEGVLQLFNHGITHSDLKGIPGLF